MPLQPDLILLVEDNQDDEALMLRAFNRNQLPNPVMVVRDGIEALDFLFARDVFSNRAGKSPPKVIVLDMKLPRLDGLGVLKAIRSDPRTRLVPVLMLTSSFQEQDLVSSYALGANSYLVKPIDFTEFMEMTRIMGQFWLKINQSPPWQHST